MSLETYAQFERFARQALELPAGSRPPSAEAVLHQIRTRRGTLVEKCEADNQFDTRLNLTLVIEQAARLAFADAEAVTQTMLVWRSTFGFRTRSRLVDARTRRHRQDYRA